MTFNFNSKNKPQLWAYTHLWSPLLLLPSLKIWIWYNSCWIPSLQEVPSRHIRASNSSLPKFVSIPSSFCLVCFPFIWLASIFPSSYFLMNFSLQFRQDRSHVNTSFTIYNGIDLLFTDILENLPVPNISTNDPDWNKLHDSYFECLFAFAKSNLYDHGVLVLAHCASANVSSIVFNWAHTYDFYVAKDWFSMTNLDLKSPVVPYGVVSNYPSPSPILFCFSCHFFQFLRYCFSGSSVSTS